MPGVGEATFPPGERLYILLWIGIWYPAKLLENVGVVSLWFLPTGLRVFCLLIFGWRGVLLELAV